jgi:hypothetical protein
MIYNIVGHHREDLRRNRAESAKFGPESRSRAAQGGALSESRFTADVQYVKKVSRSRAALVYGRPQESLESRSGMRPWASFHCESRLSTPLSDTLYGTCTAERPSRDLARAAFHLALTLQISHSILCISMYSCFCRRSALFELRELKFESAVCP